MPTANAVSSEGSGHTLQLLLMHAKHERDVIENIPWRGWDVDVPCWNTLWTSWQKGKKEHNQCIDCFVAFLHGG